MLSLLDRRDGGNYGPDDAERAALFAELAVTAIEADGDALPSLGTRRPTDQPGVTGPARALVVLLAR